MTDKQPNEETVKKIDPLRRVFVYNGRNFRTTDGRYYHRASSQRDTITRTNVKEKGKAARRAEKRERRLAREAEAAK